ncbi:PREDICTED: uncharacterized protein LOC108560082 [Nicrophorus vespilloides]|uniref:Uncharacterized protein LOC108560082 n=1 Tax=Nicrophorus vespilloides TaxID=110193 RepID=A0ABM1MEL0_NICVS|nr:PREDICTED: uncharacterized protein LOC108560082 [Nicrophorus vespilloides]
MSNLNKHPPEIKPSTEKIPDEYDFGKASVHIFVPKDQLFKKLVDTFKEAMKHCRFDVPDENVHPIKSKQDLEDIFSNIKTSDNDDKSSLIIGFFGESTDNGIYLENNEIIKIKDISSPFVFAFRNKPRLFFVQGTRRPSHSPKTDSVCKTDIKFDAPLEADQLIVFNTVDPYDDINTFMRNIAYNIENNGERDDVFDIIMFSETSDKLRPLFLSTLRKKFYFKQSPYRGYDYEFMKALEIKTNPSIVVYDSSVDNGISEMLDEPNKGKYNRSLPSLNEKSSDSKSRIYDRKISFTGIDPPRSRSNSVQKPKKPAWKP